MRISKRAPEQIAILFVLALASAPAAGQSKQNSPPQMEEAVIGGDSDDVDTTEIPVVNEADIPLEQAPPADANAEAQKPRVKPVDPTKPSARPIDPSVAKAEPKADTPSVGLYSRPLLFAPEDNRVEFTSPQIQWDMAKGRKINLGGLIFSADTIRMHLDQHRRDDVPRRLREGGRSESVVTILSFNWPQTLTRFGTLTIESDAGKTLWSSEVNPSRISDWQENLASESNRSILKGHAKTAYGLTDIDIGKEAWLKNRARVRFCLSRVNTAEEKIRICSSLHSVARQGEKIRLDPVDEQIQGLVKIGKDEIGPRGIVNFPKGKPIDVVVQFANGANVALSSRPIVLVFLDVVQTKDGETIVLTGQGAKPIGKVKDLDVPPNHFWSATGVEREIIWQTKIPVENPTIRVFGAWNVPFTYLIRYERLPSETDRVYISTRTGSGTYVNGARVRTVSPSGAKVASKENSVSKIGKNEYRWNFRALEKGLNNKSRLLIDAKDGPNWVAHYQLYRGFPYELSARLTGIVSATLETVIIGEVAGSAWFERAFGLDSYYLSEKRWGLTSRYFRALQSFAFSGDSVALDSFSILNADLKYNLLPGIWNRDELFGMIFSAQMVDIAGLQANLGGVGAYWARTMPKIFDDLFNLLPFFRYPKYVDVEFIYYPLAISSDVQPGASYSLNFHGKVFWSQRIYGEAGVGFKTFNFIQRTKEADVAVSTAFGTVGLGLIF